MLWFHTRFYLACFVRLRVFILFSSCPPVFRALPFGGLAGSVYGHNTFLISKNLILIYISDWVGQG